MKSSIQTVLQNGDDCILLEAALKSSNDNNDDTTPLMRAAKFGRLKCCEWLLSHSNDDINRTNMNLFTPLHYACFGGHEEIVVLLLSKGANPFARNIYGETPLQAAYSGNCYHQICRCFGVSPLAELNVNPKFEIEKDDSGGGSIVSPEVSKNCELVITEVDGTEPGTEQNSSLGKSFDLLSLFKTAKSTTQPCSDSVVGTSACQYLSIGRSRANDIVLNGLSVSKNHAIMLYSPKTGYWLRDCNSKHGTKVIVAQGNQNLSNIVSDNPNSVASIPSSGDCNNNDFSMLAVGADKEVAVPMGSTFCIGMMHCKLVKKVQPSVLSKGFQPNPNLAADLAEAKRLKYMNDEIKEKQQQKQQQKQLQLQQQQLLPKNQMRRQEQEESIDNPASKRKAYTCLAGDFEPNRSAEEEGLIMEKEFIRRKSKKYSNNSRNADTIVDIAVDAAVNAEIGNFRGGASRSVEEDIGGALLKKCGGWVPGSGLGKDNQGNTSALCPIVHDGKSGLGFK